MSAVLVQSVCTPIQKLQAGTAHRVYLPNPTLAGNAIICIVSWQVTTSPHPTLVVSDATNGTYSVTAGTIDAADTSQGEIAYFLNGTAGVREIVFTPEVGIGGQFMQFSVSEWAHIATTAALDGSAGQKTASTTAITPGAFATTADGNLIVQGCFSVTTSSAGDITAPTPDTTTMSGQLLYYDNLGSRFGVQFGTQTTHNASTNPVFTLPNADTCISMAAAFKVDNTKGTLPAAAGPGVAPRIVRHSAFNVGLGVGVSTFKTVFPCAQNLLHGSWVGANGTATIPILSSATDTKSNTWACSAGVAGATQGAGDCNFAHSLGATPDQGLVISWTLSHANPAATLVLYDIACDPAASIIAVSGTTGTDATTGVHNISMITVTPPNNHATLWFMDAGVEGATLQKLSSGQPNDNAFYDSEDATEQNFYENNGFGHFATSSTTGVSLSWTATNATTAWTINTIGYAASAGGGGGGGDLQMTTLQNLAYFGG